ncbi:MAG: T9SS type A sorting domain-containing protein [bacterium]|nr:T9SS type A sorting domain-containing protein [bacterium]
MSQRLLLTLALMLAFLVREPMPLAAAPAASPAVADPALTAWRAARRADVRRASLAAAGRAATAPREAAAKTLADPAPAPARFGLLVIAVDFADQRLPAGWDPAALAPRLGADAGQSLRRYFHAASASRCELVPVLAPLVRLPGRVLDYSDIGLNGFSRSRRLAREALAAVAAAGFELGLADLDGPDGLARSGDDDGWVDGVLLLHAEIGQENDPVAGRVQALQYYLEQPVTSRGINAGAYAVASLHSGPGIWAHETAHLLGLEDRYDPLLPPATGAGDIAGAGGLGVFSLMAAGALGTGGGWGPSLPDAYSRALLGWCDTATITDSPAGGDTLRAPTPDFAQAHRVWTRDGAGPEFLLLEARDPARAAPFDAALPGAGLVVLHVDEGVPEGGWAEDGPGQWHLRARLVEADADGALRQGDDAGSAGDLFPGSTAAAALTPLTSPDSDGYGGPSGVAITDIVAGDGYVIHRTVSAPAPWLRFEATWSRTTGDLECVVTAAGGAPAALSLRVETVGAPTWGALAGGDPVEIALTPGSDGRWRPAAPVRFVTDTGLPAGAATRFRYTLGGPAVSPTVAERDWVWTDDTGALDFAAAWPGDWLVEQPDGPGTSWQRWTGGASPVAAGLPVLVCTAESADPAAWPAVSYTNGGRARLTSGPLPADVAAVRLLHWVDVETLPGGVPMDGATVSWVAPDGTEMAAAPVGGWPARVDGGSGSALRGRGSFGREPGELDASRRPVWRSDVIPVPQDGPGPWRLRLELAANALWRGRGWLVADVEPLAALPEPALLWEAALAWTWPDAGVPAPQFAVEARVPPDSTWAGILATASRQVAATALLALLPGGPRARHEVRVTGPTAWGTVALGPVAVYVGGTMPAGTLGEPWPNPATGEVRLTVTLPPGTAAQMQVFDLRGRRVHARALAPGTSFVAWDGRTDEGRRLPSGTYMIRLSGAGLSSARKVVLTH